jgi:signal transduction histidine kinase
MSDTACDRAGTRIGAWTLVAALGVLIAISVISQYQAHRSATLLALDVTVGVLSWALVMAMSRWPVAASLAVNVLAAVSPAATPAATAGALQVARWRRFAVAAAVAVVGVAAHAVQGLWRPPGGLSFGWWLVLMVAAYAALVGWGALARTRRALIASLRERAERAEAEQARRVAEARALERTRIAREMHDTLAHRLSLLATYAGALEYRPDAPPEQLSAAAGVVRATVHKALDELRDVITVLRDEEAEPSRPQPVLADVRGLVEESRDAGVRVELRDRVVDADAVPANAGRTAYRVVQEGLTNARKHAAGRPVLITVDGRQGAQLVIEIRNPLNADPQGTPAVPGTGTGLVGLTERVTLAGGQLGYEVTPAAEFRLHARLPWPA